MQEELLVTEVVDRVAVIKLNRPEQANALNRELLYKVLEELEKAEWDDEIGVVILTGAGEKSFCAGLDLKERRSLDRNEVLAERERRYFPFFQRLQEFSKPIIGAINGPAIGGGAELALICDVRIATPSARFGQGEIRWGMIPSMGAIQRLRIIVGMGHAKELLLTGRVIDAMEAQRLGIYNKVVEKELLMEESFKIASEISKNSPIAVRQTKRALNVGANMSMALAYDFELSKECFYQGDAFVGPTKFGKK